MPIIATNRELFPIGIQCKSLGRDVVRILQSENKTLQAVIAFQAAIILIVPAIPLDRFPFEWSGISKNITIPVNNDYNCVIVTIASVVKCIW
jgi:hypothetical protein